MAVGSGAVLVSSPQKEKTKGIRVKYYLGVFHLRVSIALGLKWPKVKGPRVEKDISNLSLQSTLHNLTF